MKEIEADDALIISLQTIMSGLGQETLNLRDPVLSVKICDNGWVK